MVSRSSNTLLSLQAKSTNFNFSSTTFMVKKVHKKNTKAHRMNIRREYNILSIWLLYAYDLNLWSKKCYSSYYYYFFFFAFIFICIHMMCVFKFFIWHYEHKHNFHIYFFFCYTLCLRYIPSLFPRKWKICAKKFNALIIGAPVTELVFIAYCQFFFSLSLFLLLILMAFREVAPVSFIGRLLVCLGWIRWKIEDFYAFVLGSEFD